MYIIYIYKNLQRINNIYLSIGQDENKGVGIVYTVDDDDTKIAAATKQYNCV